MSNKPNDTSTAESASIKVSIGDDTAKNRLASHATEWWRRAVIIDKSLDRFTGDEREAYDYIRHIFENPSPDMELLQVHQQTIREVGMECHDEFGSAVKTFASKVSIITRDFDAFKKALSETQKQGEGRPTVHVGMTDEPVKTGHKRRLINGATWEGEFNGDVPVGSGKIYFTDGSVYEGEWCKAGPHGKGVLKWNNGEEWTATFRNGDPVKGTIKYENAVYEGDLNENGPHGHGKMVFKNRVDTGEYRDGNRYGQGRMEWDDGDWFQGEWNDNGFHGFGTYYSAKNKRTDRGTYSDGVRVGEGRMDWESGSWYQGGWNEEGTNGFGTYYNASHKRKDTGNFKNGRRTGTGRMEWDSGDVYEGGWEDNADFQPSGKGVYRYASGKTERGRYENGNWIPEGTLTTTTATQPRATQRTTETRSSSGDLSAWTITRNVIAWIGTAILIAVTINALFGSGNWYEVIGTAILTLIAMFVYAGDGINREGFWNPATLFGGTLIISGIVYIVGSIWIDYPWYWFIGGVFWGFIGLAAVGIGCDDSIFD